MSCLSLVSAIYMHKHEDCVFSKFLSKLSSGSKVMGEEHLKEHVKLVLCTCTINFFSKTTGRLTNFQLPYGPAKMCCHENCGSIKNLIVPLRQSSGYQGHRYGYLTPGICHVRGVSRCPTTVIMSAALVAAHKTVEQLRTEAALNRVKISESAGE